jgi:CHRD domain
MKVTTLLLGIPFALALSAVPSTARSAEIFTADLLGAEEVPPISTNARGLFVGVLDDGATTLSFTLLYFGLEGGSPPVVAHIHFGSHSVNGGVVAFFCGGGGKPACPADGVAVTGTITAADVVGAAAQGITAGEFAELARAMRNGNTYANVHTGAFASGEIRGQVR